MLCKILILFTLVSHALSDSCVRYTFEEGFNELFVNDRGVCFSMPSWDVGKYSDLNVAGQHELSTSYIAPLTELSCVNSFNFSMTSGGTIEANIYMEATGSFDQIIVIAFMVADSGDRVTGQAVHFALDPNFVSGWHTLKMTLTGSGKYEGYLSILGMASPNSIVLVDSFRYMPPSMDESECQLYEDLPKANHPTFNHFKA